MAKTYQFRFNDRQCLYLQAAVASKVRNLLKVIKAFDSFNDIAKEQKKEYEKILRILRGAENG